MFKGFGSMLAFMGVLLVSLGLAQSASRPQTAVQQLRVMVLTNASLPELNDLTERYQRQQKKLAACMRSPIMKVARYVRLENFFPGKTSQSSRIICGFSLGALACIGTSLVSKKYARNLKHRTRCAFILLLLFVITYDFARALVIVKEIDRIEQLDLRLTYQYLSVLAGLNIPFEVVASPEQELQLSDFLAQDTLRYHLVIQACAPHFLSEETQRAVTAAKDFGVQIVDDQNEARLDRRHLIDLLTRSSPGIVRPAMGGIMALRMDDPGAPIKAYFDGYRHTGLSPAKWRQVVSLLEQQQAEMSIFYVPAWVDDGDAARGILEHEGKIVAPRIPGRIYDAKSVVYTVHENAVRMDQAAEYEILKAAAPTLDFESHAHTHMEIDLECWLQAADKYSNKAWYRELYHLHDDRDLTVEETRAVLQNSADKIAAWFAKAPTTLVPPGHKISSNTLHVAGKMGFRLLAMNTVFLLDSTHYLEAGYVRNPGFEHWQDFDASLIVEGFPVIGYMHDRDIALLGSAWLARGMRGWQGVGIRRFVTFRELAGLLRAKITAHVARHSVSGWVDISGTGGIGDRHESRYFAQHEFPLHVTLPAGRRATRAVLNDSTHADITILSPREIMLRLPPFTHTAEQRFVIQLD
ncbi:MAG: polysaccharide deacetylase family protein [bacterium]